MHGKCCVAVTSMYDVSFHGDLPGRQLAMSTARSDAQPYDSPSMTSEHCRLCGAQSCVECRCLDLPKVTSGALLHTMAVYFDQVTWSIS
jgi:hypothetical protein